MLVISPSDLDRREAGDDGDDDAGDDRRDVGRAELRVHLADAGRQQAVAAHREEDARLAHEHDEQHAGDAGDGAGRDEAGRPVLLMTAQRVADRRVEELRVVLELHDRDDAAQDAGDDQVEQRADDQRGDDADRQVAAAGSWPPPRSSTRRRSRCRRRRRPPPPVMTPGPAVGHERRPVLRLRRRPTPTTMKNRTAASLMATIAALKRALSRTPTTSSTMISEHDDARPAG